jgi:arginine/lysine/ornithine decarboxylase
MTQEYIEPIVEVLPQDAFYAEKEFVPIKQSVGRVSCEFVMCYPPGIPIIAPGERITDKIIDYILYSKEKGCTMTGTEDPDIKWLNVIKGGC